MDNATKARVAAKSHLLEPLEFRVERLYTGQRLARIQGATSGRELGTVSAQIGRRLIVSANACQFIREPELLPDLIQALNNFFDARPHERASATDKLWAAAVACGALEE